MTSFDAIVVGSGPAGVACAQALPAGSALMLDVGIRPPEMSLPEGNLYDLRARGGDLSPLLIGERFEGLRNLHQRPVSLKLKSPGTAFVIRDWERLCPVVSDTFEAVLSFARGGLANAWGAGVYRFTRRDMEGWPIHASDLEPYYDQLTAQIGISGTSDDLSPYFGSAAALQPPMRLCAFAARRLDRYRRRAPELRARGVFLGRPRLAVLTEALGGRAPYQYDNLEFFRALNPAIYNPAFTLDELLRRNHLRYLSQRLVTSYREHGGGLEVSARNTASGEMERFRCRRLFLGAGALSSARIVLESSGDHETRLPLLDNPMSSIPMFDLGRIGTALDPHDSSLAQLNLVYDDPETGEIAQGTLYGATGPLRTDVLFQLPLSITANLALARHLAPAMGLLMMFHADRPRPGNYLRLRADGALEAAHQGGSLGRVERRLIAAFRRLGCVSFASLCQYPRIGSSLHYAGLLPMAASPGPYQTDPSGRLFGTRGVYIVDGAAFPTLPAKNLTFTIMANAMRIARGACAGDS